MGVEPTITWLWAKCDIPFHSPAVTPTGLEPVSAPWKGAILDRLDDGAFMTGIPPANRKEVYKY